MIHQITIQAATAKAFSDPGPSAFCGTNRRISRNTSGPEQKAAIRKKFWDTKPENSKVGQTKKACWNFVERTAMFARVGIQYPRSANRTLTRRSGRVPSWVISSYEQTNLRLSSDEDPPKKAKTGYKEVFFLIIPDGHYIFLLLGINEHIMDFMPMIFGFLAAYGAFVIVGYVLARLMFPSLEEDDEKIRKPRFRMPKWLIGR